ncbi:MAG: glycosyltransferase family 4 protein [Chloroflexi bacterium]|nr:glycosyltransferase family 4 protein [Chloroflexota bacterium]
MRISMVGPFGLAPKGTMRARALPLARALVARGHAVNVVMPPWHTPAEPARVWDEDGVRLEYVSLAPRCPGLHPLVVSGRLLRRALAWRPDALYVFKPIGYAGAALQWAVGLRRVGGYRGRVALDEDDWEGVGGWNALEERSWLARQVIARQERWGLTHADAVTVASRALESLVWSLGVPPQRVNYLPNGSVPAVAGDGQAARARYGLGSAPVVLLYTRFFEFDVERPLRVLGRVLAQAPAARLLVVGQALHPADDARFDRRAAELGLAANVVRTGWLPADALPDCFAAADAALYPFDDTLLNRCKCAAKLVELLAAGVPVVADAVGQNVEYIVQGESGLLVPSGDEQAMAEGVLRLLHEPRRSAELGEAAARRMRAQFGWEQLAEIVLRALQG